MPLPDRLYKYQPIGPHTALNLVLLLTKKTLFFPRKHALNDPTDCEPNLVIPHTVPELKNALDQIQRASDVMEFLKEEAAKVSDRLDREPLPPTQAPKLMVRTFPELGPIDKARNLVRAVMRISIGIPRIFSMSSNYQVGQMWSYYANSHRGICLEIKGMAEAGDNPISQRVIYTTERPQIFLEDVLELSRDGTKRDAIVKKLYCVKSDAWKHEDEYRLVAQDSAVDSRDKFLSIPDGDFYRIESARLSGVYFGQHCSDGDKWMVKDLISANTSPKHRPEIYEVAQANDSYDFTAVPSSYDRYASLFSLGTSALATPTTSSKSLADVLSGSVD